MSPPRHRRRRHQPEPSSSTKEEEEELIFPVEKIRLRMKKGLKIDRRAATFMAAVLKSVTERVLERAGKDAQATLRNRIEPNHVVEAMVYDSSVWKLLTQGGVILPDEE